ncbi:hypothetical protein J41TS2_00270 [Bacillus sonorensis]|nr:hypothetical protein J41TS2_00270 [Bacillus sonorensis]
MILLEQTGMYFPDLASIFICAERKGNEFRALSGAKASAFRSPYTPNENAGFGGRCFLL